MDFQEAARDARHQEALVRFLSVTLDVAFTFMSIARQGWHKPERLSVLVLKSKAALETVRRFEDKVQDVLALEILLARADELEATIQLFDRGNA